MSHRHVLVFDGLDSVRHELPEHGALLAEHGAFDAETGRGVVIRGKHCRHHHEDGRLVDSIGRRYDEWPLQFFDELLEKHGDRCPKSGLDLTRCVTKNGGAGSVVEAKAAKAGVKRRKFMRELGGAFEVRFYSLDGEHECGTSIAHGYVACRYDVAESFTPPTLDLPGVMAAHASLRAAWTTGRVEGSYHSRRRQRVNGQKGDGYTLHIPPVAAQIIGKAVSDMKERSDARRNARIARMSALIGRSRTDPTGTKAELLKQRNELASEPVRASSRTVAELKTEIVELRDAEIVELKTELLP